MKINKKVCHVPYENGGEREVVRESREREGARLRNRRREPEKERDRGKERWR